MNLSLDILNNNNETFENDAVIINLVTEAITWKAGMFDPKMNNNIKYWFNEKRKK